MRSFLDASGIQTTLFRFFLTKVVADKVVKGISGVNTYIINRIAKEGRDTLS